MTNCSCLETFILTQYGSCSTPRECPLYIRRCKHLLCGCQPTISNPRACTPTWALKVRRCPMGGLPAQVPYTWHIMGGAWLAMGGACVPWEVHSCAVPISMASHGRCVGGTGRRLYPMGGAWVSVGGAQVSVGGAGFPWDVPACACPNSWHPMGGAWVALGGACVP